jgi:nicotinamidase/pyrazinamidase
MTIETGLLMVDPQNDFCPGGALPVKDGDKVMDPLNVVSRETRLNNGLVVVSRDFHPAKTTHFAKYGGIWPEHCVQGTKGVRFHRDLDVTGALIVSKGMGETEDAYSAFDARFGTGEMLEELLRKAKIRKLIVGGLATDYCVKASVLGGLERDFDVTLLTDAIRAVNLKPGDGDKAIEEMVKAGARLSTSREVVSW